MKAKGDFRAELESLYTAKMNGVQQYDVKEDTFTFVNGKQTLSDMELTRKAMDIIGGATIKIRHAGGFFDITYGGLTELIEQMILRGYYLWERFSIADEELKALDTSSPDFQEAAQSILDKF